MHLLLCDNDFPITVIINSGGGDWDEALAIYDTIIDADTIVTAEVRGKCMSAAVPIVQACEVRLIHPNAVVMVHNGSYSLNHDSQSFAAWGRRAKLECERMYRILATKSQTPAYWRRKCAQGDFIMDSERAVQLGLFDRVLTRDDE